MPDSISVWVPGFPCSKNLGNTVNTKLTETQRSLNFDGAPKEDAPEEAAVA